jgi:hypothetical protein
VEILLFCSIPHDVNKNKKIRMKTAVRDIKKETEYLKVFKYFVAPSTRMERYVKLSSTEENTI